MAASAPAPSASKTRALAGRAWRGTKRLMLYSALAVIALAGLYLLAAYHFSYSTGERAGYVQKFSKKGWLCKTWEGELAMANLPGAMPEKFAFTLHDDTVAAQINKAMGQRVTLSYEQKVGLPSCFGDTPYWVTQVRAIEPAK